MAIKSKSHNNSIKAYIDKWIAQKEATIVRNLAYLGESCVNTARDSEGYRDQTSNLRSSTGWLLLKDGNIVSSGGFTSVKSEGEDGATAGENYAKSLMLKYNSGYVLIIVAGMNYAAKLEATGRDVLTSAEQYAKENAPGLMKMLGLK